MAKILPAINCHFGDDKAVAARIRDIENIFDRAAARPEERWAHFDVADGIFTFNRSWNEPELLAEIRPGFEFEAHLMVDSPASIARRWLAAGAKRIIVHVETVSLAAFSEVAAMASALGAEAVLALNPETSVADARPYFDRASNFLILAVHPGLSGQKFLPLVLEKISVLRREVPDAKIEVDGGINPETARAAIAVGADSLVSGSDIFDNSDPEGEYEVLRSI